MLPGPWCLYYRAGVAGGGLMVKHSFFTLPFLRNPENRHCVFVVDPMVSHAEYFRTKPLILPAFEIVSGWCVSADSKLGLAVSGIELPHSKSQPSRGTICIQRLVNAGYTVLFSHLHSWQQWRIIPTLECP